MTNTQKSNRFAPWREDPSRSTAGVGRTSTACRIARRHRRHRFHRRASTRARPGSPARVVVGVAASSPERADAARAAELGAERALRHGRGPDRRRRHRRRPRLHPQPPAPAARRAPRSRPASTSSARSRSRSTPPAPPAGRAAPPRAASSRPCPSSTATTRRCARPARRVRAGELGDAPAAARRTTCRTGCSRPADDNWRVDADLGGASRAFADIGSHWCDLVEFVTGAAHRRACGAHRTAVPQRRAPRPARARSRAATAASAPRAVDTEDVAVVHVRDRRRRRSARSSCQPGLRRPQEPPLARDRRHRRPLSASTRSSPRRSGSAAAPASSAIPRDPATLAPEAARLRDAARPATRRATGLLRRLRRRRPTRRSPARRRRRAAGASPTACAPSRSPRPCSSRRRPRRGSDVGVGSGL